MDKKEQYGNLKATLSSASQRQEVSGALQYTLLKGFSAYEIAVQQGFTGSEKEWLESLKVYSETTIYISSKPQEDSYDIEQAIKDIAEQALNTTNFVNGALVSLIQPFEDGANNLLGSGYVMFSNENELSGALTLSVKNESIEIVGAYDYYYNIDTDSVVLEKKIIESNLKEYAKTEDISNNYVKKQDGKSLVDDEEYDKLKDDVATAILIAQGKVKGYVFNTYIDMISWLDDEDNIKLLNVGDNLLIIEKNVPDYWWTGDDIVELETEKIDLEGYAKKEDLDNHKDSLVASENGTHGLRYDVEEELLIATDADGNEHEIKTDGGSSVDVDIEMSDESTNAVQNKVIKQYIDTVSEKTKEIISDEWKDNIVYGVGAYVIHDNKMWKCLVQHSGQTPTEGTYWKQVSIASEITQLNSDKVNSNVVDRLFATDGTIDSTSDWNNIKTPGFYKKLIGFTNQNSPATNRYFYCFVAYNTNLSLTQIAIPYSTGLIFSDMYVRTFYGSTWSAWTKIGGRPKLFKSNVEKTSSLQITSNSTVKKVIYSLRAENVEKDDIISIDAMFETTNPTSANVMIGYYLVRTGSEDAVEGINISGAVAENVTPNMHHMVSNISAKDTGVEGTFYYNLVAYAASSSVSGDATVEDGGLMTMMIY